MKRNMVAILDEDKKEQDELREAILEQKFAVTVTSIEKEKSSKRLLPPRHDFMKKKMRLDPKRLSNPSGFKTN
jgi:hypothetical protein